MLPCRPAVPIALTHFLAHTAHRVRCTVHQYNTSKQPSRVETISASLFSIWIHVLFCKKPTGELTIRFRSCPSIRSPFLEPTSACRSPCPHRAALNEPTVSASGPQLYFFPQLFRFQPFLLSRREQKQGEHAVHFFRPRAATFWISLARRRATPSTLL